MKTAHAGGWQGQQRRARWGRGFLVGLTLLVFMLPLLWSLLASLGVLPDDSQSPPTWSWPPKFDTYVEIGVTSPDFAQDLGTSIGVSAAATALTILVSFLAAYSLSRSRFRGIWTAVQGFLILACVPVMAYAIPLSDTVRHLHLYDTFAGMALANTAVYAPLAVYVLYGYLKQVPVELEESARLEGVSVWQIIWRVVLPSAAPGAAATAIIVFVLNWNMLLVPQVLSEGHVKTIPLLLTDFFKLEREIDWPSAAAVLITSLVPLAAFVIAVHRILERFNLTPSQPAT
jgi:ABC-type glycerol-3-phosphate transport system permease component